MLLKSPSGGGDGDDGGDNIGGGGGGGWRVGTKIKIKIKTMPAKTKILVLLSALVERFGVSRMRDFELRFSIYTCQKKRVKVQMVMDKHKIQIELKLISFGFYCNRLYTTVLGPHSYHWGVCYQQGLPCLVLISL